MKGHKFLRTGTNFLKRIGGTSKKLRWRKPRGRHNKIREKVKGKPIKPSIGLKKPEKEKVKIKVVTCLREIESIGKGQNVIIAKFGKRKRKIIIEMLKEKGAKILNIKKE